MAILNETIAESSFESENAFITFVGRVLIVFYCSIFILGLIGNSIVIYVAIHKKKYKNVTNCYVINLAVADLLFLTLAVPYTTYLAVVTTNPLGGVICKIYTYLAYVFLLATCNTLAAMSIDRCFYIVLPHNKLQCRTPKSAFVICVCIWTSSVALLIPYHIILHMIASNSNTCNINDHMNFPVCFLIFCSYYALPLAIIIICYTKLAMHVIQSNRLITSHIHTKTMSETLKKRQRQVTTMVIVVTLAFAVCWLPIHILELMKCSNSSLLYSLIESYPRTLYSIRAFTHALAYFNSCLNPYLYALLNRNFCSDLIEITPKWLRPRRRRQARRTESHRLKDTCFTTADHFKRRIAEDDDGEIDYHERVKQNVDDAACQIELLELTRT